MSTQIDMGNMEDEYEYQLIEFVRRGPKTMRREVDFVPCHWVIYNKKKGKLEVKFLPPPYDEENCKLLHDLVRMKADPPIDWPTYNVLVKGGARSYSDAVERLRKLNDEEYAFTHDSDVTPQQKVQKVIEKHKQLKLKVTSETKAALRVPGLSDSEADTEKEIYSEKKTITEKKTKKADDKRSKTVSNSDVDSTGTDEFSTTKSMCSKLSYIQVYSNKSGQEDEAIESSACLMETVSNSGGAISEAISSRKDKIKKSTAITETKRADKRSRSVSHSDVDSTGTNDFSLTQPMNSKLPDAKIYSDKSRPEDKASKSSVHLKKSDGKSGGAIRKDISSRKDENKKSTQITKSKRADKRSRSVSHSDVDSTGTNDFSLTQPMNSKFPDARIYSDKSRQEDKVSKSSTHINKSVGKSGRAIRKDISLKADQNKTCNITGQEIKEKTRAVSSSGSTFVRDISTNDDGSKNRRTVEEKLKRMKGSEILREIYFDLQEIKKDIQNINSNLLESKQAQQGLQILEGIREDFIAKNNISLPIVNIEEFNDFDSKLLEDPDYGKEFMASLVKYFDRHYIASRTIANILRKYFSKGFAMKCTAIKKMPNKTLLKGTAFYDHLLGAVSQSHRDPISRKKINDSTFGIVFGSVLSNAKDWAGGREAKKKQESDSDDSDTFE